MASTPLFPAATGSTLASMTPTSAEKDDMIRFLQRLVQTPSHSTQEGDVARLVEAELRAVGVEDVFVDRAGNVVARIGSGSGPTLLYDAHMDTVLATAHDWPHDPYAGFIEEGKLYGLGACDMKATIAAMVYAAKRLLESGAALHGTLVLAFVVQEEPCEGFALKVLVEEEGIRPNWVLLGEPSDLQIKRGHRGRVMFKVTVPGKSSHASSPDLGENAITAAARLLFGIDLLMPTLPTDPFLGPGTIAVTHIESQSPSLNAIPNSCTFYIDRRLTLGETPTRAQAQIEGVVQREGLRASIDVLEYAAQSYSGYVFKTREAFNAWALEEDHMLIQALSAAARSVNGTPPPVGRWSFSTDGVYSMGEAHIPTVGFGPGKPEFAHTIHEHVDLDDVAAVVPVYGLLATMLLAKS